MRHITLFALLLLATAIGCESDAVNYKTYVQILAIDSAKFGIDSSASVIVLEPVDSMIPIRQIPLGSLSDSVMLFWYAHALVSDSLNHPSRKHWTSSLSDTVRFYFDQVVDSLGMNPPIPGLDDEYKLDSIVAFLPSVRTPKIVSAHP